jgi:RHS repeat-associated protein
LAGIHYDDGITTADNYYYYTHDGERWKAARNGESTWYLGTLEYDGTGDRMYKYVSIPSITCSMNGGEASGGNSKCHFSDGFNYVATFDESGTLLEKKEFLPYGLERVIDGVWQKIGYGNGAEQEPWFAEGVYFMGSRYYDRVTRQFSSIDPARLEGAGDTIRGQNSLQPYVYGGADPISSFDPTGRQPVPQVVDPEMPPDLPVGGPAPIPGQVVDPEMPPDYASMTSPSASGELGDVSASPASGRPIADRTLGGGPSAPFPSEVEGKLWWAEWVDQRYRPRVRLRKGKKLFREGIGDPKWRRVTDEMEVQWAWDDMVRAAKGQRVLLFLNREWPFPLSGRPNVAPPG